MTLLGLLAVLAVAALVQTLNSSAIGVPGARPDLVLLLVLAWGLLRGTHEGSLAGLAGGLFLDLFTGMPFGINCVLLGTLGLVAGFGEGSFTRSHIPLLASTALLSTVALHGGTYLLLQGMGWNLPGAVVFGKVVAPTAVLNAVGMIVAFHVARRLLGSGNRSRPFEV